MKLKGILVTLILVGPSSLMCLLGQSGPIVTVSLRQGTVASGALVSTDSARIRIKAEDGSVQAFGWNEISTISPAEKGGSKAAPPSNNKAAPTHGQWVASIQPKASLTEGTQSQQTIGGLAAFRYWTDSQSVTARFDANNSLTTQKGTPSIRSHEYDGDIGDQFFLNNSKTLYLHGIADGYHNSSLNLYLEQFYGGGAGGTVWSSKTDKLTFTGDVLFVSEHFTMTKGEEFPALRLNQSYVHSFGSHSDAKTPIVFTETVSGLPSLDRANAWQLRAGAELSIPLNKLFSVSLGFNDDYMENAPNARKNYSSSSVGVSYSFPAN